MGVLAWPLLLLLLGLLLLIAEVFIPSGGMIGLLAAGCLAISLWQAFRQSSQLGFGFVLADFVLLPATAGLALYVWPKTPMGRRVLLRPPLPEEIAVSHTESRLDLLIGQSGRALTPMRPSGTVEFDGRRLDGLSEAGFIEAGSRILAVRVRAGQVVVRTVTPALLDGPMDTMS